MTAERPRPAIDDTVAHPARVYDFLIGGKDNYAPDRALAEAMTARLPGLPEMLRANRDFLGRAVRHLVAERGVTQFLDIGSGIPTAANVHQVAQRIDPSARVVYVDNDPMVLAHARALMVGTPQGRTAFVAGDANDPRAILADPVVFGTLDRERPVALMLVSLLMYFPDDVAHEIVRVLLDALPSGSHLTISHPTVDFDPTGGADAAEAGAGGGIAYHNRTRDEVERFFAGLDLVEPGIVPMLEWRPGIAHPRPRSVYYWVGMGTKP
jgi:O-methyltransferase involved in polyketide biosynthesis